MLNLTALLEFDFFFFFYLNFALLLTTIGQPLIHLLSGE